MEEYRIEKADTREKYEGLRELWHRVFGDDPAFVDYVYELFGDEIEGYVAIGQNGRVASALTCYRCGDLCGRPVYVSYAICTEPEYRGQGLAGNLTAHVRTAVTEAGGISLVSPAEASLEEFYAGLGYSRACMVREHVITEFGDLETGAYSESGEGYLWSNEDDDFEPAEISVSLTRADAAEYNRYREEYLADIPHVSMSEKMLELVRTAGIGGSGLYIINGGDAICAVTEGEQEAEHGGDSEGALLISELIVNPALKSLSEEIDEELAESIRESFGRKTAVYRTPAQEDAGDSSGDSGLAGSVKCQSMSAGVDRGTLFYFGFPVE